MDLLTVVMHEIGHVLGYGDLDPAAASGDLMSATLAEGVRRLPGVTDAPLAPLAWDEVSGSLKATLDSAKPLAGVTSFTPTAAPMNGNGAAPTVASPDRAASSPIDWTRQYRAPAAWDSPSTRASDGDPILPPVEFQLAIG